MIGSRSSAPSPAHSERGAVPIHQSTTPRARVVKVLPHPISRNASASLNVPNALTDEMDKVASGWGNVYPTFSRASIRSYRQHNRSNIALQFYIPIILITLVHFVTRYDLQELGGGKAASGLLQAGFAVATVAYVLFNVALVPYVLVAFPRWQDVKDRWAGWIDLLPVLIEEVILVLALLSIGLVFLYRVMVGACPAGTSIWKTQSCNPLADLGGLPPEMAMFLYGIIIGVQVVLKNVSLPGLFAAWLIAAFFMSFATIYTGAWVEIWDVVEILYMANISFEIERQQRVSYARLVLSQMHKRESLERQRKSETIRRALDQHELMLDKERSAKQLASQKAEADRKLRQDEAQQLRSLMGNVAHDLKTPLFSFEADVETLKVFFDALPPAAVNATVDALSTGGGEIHPAELFESLWATMRFMVAAINRGQDYTKATNGVALVPANGSFEVAQTVAMVHRCVKHLFPEGRHLVIHPMPSDMCGWIISDAHWMLENMLCYISNAIKYSDGGDVDMYIELVPVDEHEEKEDEEDESPLPPFDDNVTMHRTVEVTSGHGSTVDVTAITQAALARAAVTCKSPVERTSHRVRVTIEDHGVGIPGSQRTVLFQPFRQAQRMTGGTGLGLFSMLKRVEALGGDCGVSERRDGRSGSSFWFSFPYRPDDTVTSSALHTPVQSPRREERSNLPPPVNPRMEDIEAALLGGSISRDVSADPLGRSGEGTAAKAVAVPPMVPGELALSVGLALKQAPTVAPLRILLTDDTPSILKVVGRLLRSSGHTVETAINGSKCLDRLKATYENNECDMLLTDLQMPVMDGIECVRRFRAWEAEEAQRRAEEGLPQRERFVIVGMSANSDAQSRQDAMAAGMDHFVNKPFKYEALEAFLAKHWAISEVSEADPTSPNTGRRSFVAIRKATATNEGGR